MSVQYDCIVTSNEPTFELRGFLTIYEEIAPFLVDPCAICIDLSHPNLFGPSGMVPLIALVEKFSSAGWEIDFKPPEPGTLLNTYWESAGWHQALRGDPLPNPRSRRTFIPVVHFEDHKYLNATISAAIDVLSTTSEYPSGVLNAIQWTMNEITDNVLVHSGTSGWLQVIARPKQHAVDFVVVDCGVGLPRTLRQNYPQITEDKDLIVIALERGVTRDASIGQGNGLAGSLRIAEALSGWLSIASRNAVYRLVDDGSIRFSSLSNFPGTIVSMSLKTTEPINLSDALWGYSPPSAFEISHVTQAGIMFVLGAEQSIYGNRATGAELSLRLTNIMNENPNEKVIVDFSGIDITSASFLDEFVAKTATRLGIATFFKQVQVVNASEFVERTLNEVIRQRAQVH